MKKNHIYLLTFIIFILFCSTACSENSNATYSTSVKSSSNVDSNIVTMRLTIENTMISNEHCGNEWTNTYQINGSTVKNGEILKFNKNDTISIYIRIVEEDSIPDISEYSGDSINLTNYPNGFSQTINMTVNERGGTRYKNAYATFKVVVKFQKI